MKLRTVVLASLLGTISLPALAAPVATVNGRSIDSSQVQAILSMSPELAKEPNARQQVVQNLINMEVLSQYAKKHGLAKSAIPY